MTPTIELTDLTPPEHISLRDVALWLASQDNVAIAKTPLRPGTVLVHDAAGDVRVPIRQFIPAGHKIALCDLAPDAPIYRYGQVIGFASAPIAAGDHVHTHNVTLRPVSRDSARVARLQQPVEDTPEAPPQTFQGFKRESGHVGTRNYIAVIATVNCSAHVCHAIAAHFTPERLQAFPNVDGAIPITHAFGCTDRVGSPNYKVLQRTLAGIARHPNVAGALLVGLGCEVNQAAELVANHALDANRTAIMTIQESGGVRNTVAAGIAAVEGLLETANTFQRSQQPISELTVALQCGGSDSWSGVTANPVIGLVSDAIVRQGGTAVLAETPELYGAEHLLIDRAAQPEIGQAISAKIAWWHDYTSKFDLAIDNNPSTGNKAGGLTTIYEKSLGAVAKGGRSPLVAVYDYAEPITARGLVFMDTPGYDPVSVTGQVAGGCTIVLFSTGRGSVFGCAAAPSIKIATNTATFEHMHDDMDFNAGRVLNGESQHAVARDLLDLLVAVASGQPSASEAQGIGRHEFIPWMLGGVI